MATPEQASMLLAQDSDDTSTSSDSNAENDCDGTGDNNGDGNDHQQSASTNGRVELSLSASFPLPTPSQRMALPHAAEPEPVCTNAATVVSVSTARQATAKPDRDDAIDDPPPVEALSVQPSPSPSSSTSSSSDRPPQLHAPRIRASSQPPIKKRIKLSPVRVKRTNSVKSTSHGATNTAASSRKKKFCMMPPARRMMLPKLKKIKPSSDGKFDDTKSSSQLRRKLHLPLKKKLVKRPKTKPSLTTPANESEKPRKTPVNGVMEAMVVESDDDSISDDEVVASIVERQIPAPTKVKSLSSATVGKSGIGLKTKLSQAIPPSSSVNASSSTSQRRKPFRNTPQVKSIRLPPITSPGLLMVWSSGLPKSAMDESGLVRPSAVFDSAMQAAGYTDEVRKKRPHRGSSTKREVGDIFDRDIATALRAPSLVPKRYLEPTTVTGKKTHNTDDIENGARAREDSPLAASANTAVDATTDAARRSASGAAIESNDFNAETEPVPSLMHQLIEYLKPSAALNNPSNGHGNSRVNAFPRSIDMMPVSLKIQYPDFFVQKRMEYLDQVRVREEAIVTFQEEQDRLETEFEARNELPASKQGRTVRSTAPPKPSVVIPPIPKLPEPPSIQECGGIKPDDYSDEHKPYYLIKGKERLSTHLDQSCFHITEGRYFGLSSNFVADPSFVGANAPGIAGNSSTSGLATSTAASSGTVSNGMLVAMSAANNVKEEPLVPTLMPTKAQKNLKGSSKKPSAGSASRIGTSKQQPASMKSMVGKDKLPTVSMSQLRQIMDTGGEEAARIRQRILRAAVYASRTNNHGSTFKGPNGETFPDVTKAFAAYGNIKPCNKCKNNKQGAYHCRVRRRHKELDYDGGDSPGLLAPLFAAPLESLPKEDF